MMLCGFVGCPADACAEVKEIADYVSDNVGGTGVVRDVISYLLKKRGQWQQAIEQAYEVGI